MTFQHLFNEETKKKLNSISTQNALKLTSIGGKRILAILDDLKKRIEYALLLPTINDFIQASEDIDESIQEISQILQDHQESLLEVMTTDGEPKPGSQQDFEEERNLYKDCARDLIRAMRNHADYFAPLLAQSMSSGGAAV